MKTDRVFDSAERITDSAVESSATSRVPKGSILLVTRSGILRHSLPVAVSEAEVTINQDLKALIPHCGINADFIAWALRRYEDEVLHSCAKSGTTVQSIEFNRLLRFEIPLAPHVEQRRVVSVIEEQLTRLDAAVAALKRLRANLKRYRASVLKAAVEGRLVPTEAELARAEGRDYEPGDQLLARILRGRRAIWEARRKAGKAQESLRSRHAKGYREPAPPDVARLPKLPKGWTWVRWGQIGFCQNGRAFPSREYAASGIKLLRPGNLHANGRIVWTAANTRLLPVHWADEFSEFIVQPDQLVMNLTAQSLKDEFLGRVCITGPGERCLLNQRLARLVPVLVSPRYLLWMLKSEVFRRFVNELNTGSLIQHMFTSQLEDFAFPLPPLPEQLRIVAEIERRLSTIEAIEQIVRSNPGRAAMSVF